MVLVITDEHDEHAPLVCSRLDRLGIANTRFHPDTYPRSSSLSLEYSPSLSARLIIDPCHHSAIIDLQTVTAVWYRRPQPCGFDAALSEPAKAFCKGEADHLLHALYSILGNCRWLNTPDAIVRASLKPDQLVTANACGLRIPRSIITNDPEAAIHFLDTVTGATVYKGLSGYMPFNSELRRSEAIYTNIVTRDDIYSRRNEIKYAPCLFQESIPKKYEVRVTVVGRTIFAAVIESQRSSRSKVDWRHYDLTNTPYYPTILPADVASCLLSFMDCYSLSFGCFDIIVTPSDEYVFVEINPNGQWYWIEALTRLPIANEITAFLGGAEGEREQILARLNEV